MLASCSEGPIHRWFSVPPGTLKDWKYPARRIAEPDIQRLEGEFSAEFYCTAALGAFDLAKIGAREVSVGVIELRRVSYSECLGAHLQPSALGNRKPPENARVEVNEFWSTI